MNTKPTYETAIVERRGHGHFLKQFIENDICWRNKPGWYS